MTPQPSSDLALGDTAPMRLKHLILIAAAVCTLCLGSLRAFAQFDTASIVGRVTDSTGALVKNAKVTATNDDTNVSISRVSNGAGEYNIPALKPGTYHIEIEEPGFSTAIRKNIKLEIGTNQRVDMAIAAGDTQTVSVDENQLELETATSQKQQVITAEQVESFPLQNMDYTDLLTLSAGVTQDAAGQDLGTSSVVREGSYNVNGMRSTYNNYLLDGLDNNAHGTSNQGFSNQVIQPSQYNLSEFAIVTTLPAAEYGRSAGGTFNVAFKTGTNKFHAQIYESLRNTVLNSNGYFRAAENAGASSRTTVIRNQFGGSAGGPLLKNRAFFFVDYEGLRQSRQVVNQSNVFNLTDHQLIASPNATANTTYVLNPFTGATYAADRPLPRNVLSPIALSILDAYPLPNNNGAGANSISSDYSALQRFVNSYDKEDARFDMQFNPRTAGFLRVSQSKEHDLDGSVLPAPLATGNGYFRIINQQVALGLTRQIGHTQLLEARLGASYTKGGKMPGVLGNPNTFGVQGLPTDPTVYGGLTSLSIDGYSAIGRQSTNPQWQYPFFLNPKLTYSWLLGRHNLKAGYEFSYLREIVQDVNPIYGQMSFSSSFTGYDISDFLFGVPNEIDMTNLLVAHVRQGGHSAFLQDDWKIASRLTLNIGVRYEYASHFYEKDSRLTNFDPTITPQTGQMIRAAASGSAYQKQLIDPDLNDFMPRIGLAYAPTSNLVVHAGYGIGYVHYTRSGEDDNLAVNGPQMNAAVFNQAPVYNKPGITPTSTFYSLDNGYPQGMSSPANFNLFTSAVKYIPRNYRDPYVESWFVGFQSRLSKTMLFDLAYVGNHGVKLQEAGNWNQRNPALGKDPVTGYFKRPYNNLGDVLITYNGGMSNYNGLQARFQAKGFHGLWLLNAFTWSRTLGNVSDPLTATHGFSGSPQDYFAPASNDYGPLQYDIPLLNNTALSWKLPIGRGQLIGRHMGSAMNQALGGWQITFYNQFHSGPALTPNFTPAGTQELSNSGGIQYRPFFAAGATRQSARQRLHIAGRPEEAFCDSVYASSTQANYNGCTVQFATANPNPKPNPTSNDADWSGTANDPRGNVPNGFLRGDNFDQLDAGINKYFNLPWNRSRFEFRLQFYNILNKTNFTVPGMTCCSTSFGRITSSYGPGRIGQVQGRLWF
ncbi:MAG: TonB-dependent receptor [Acidobacteriaceae bacterium]|nr:TonB-dependent receptor [Acidobacteriaceae bacterium]